MSIRQELWNRRTEGRIVQLTSMIPTDPNLRTLYVTRELHDVLMADRSDDEELERYADLEADLHGFISNRLIGPSYLKGLEPASNGVWEIRSRKPRPSIRVFCMFAEKDCLICTHHVLRKSLGGPASREWRDEVERAKSIWRQLFNPYNPLYTNDTNQLFTGATHEYFEK